MLFGHSGHELQRFENLVFSKFIWNCRCSDVYTGSAYSIQCNMYVFYVWLKRCNSCLETKFSQQTNLSMKISILGSISAENEDIRSMKITQIGEYAMLRNMHDSTYLIFVHHEGEPMQVFYSTKKMQLSRFVTDI